MKNKSLMKNGKTISKKILSFLLAFTVVLTSVSVGMGSLTTFAGAANGGVESINAFSLVQNGDAIGTSFNTYITIKSKANGYRIKVNSISATIRYSDWANESSVLYSVHVDTSACGAVCDTSGKIFSVMGSLSAGLAGLIRYECNYDLLDDNGNVVYAGMTGYGYGAVSANGEETGAIGIRYDKPGDMREGSEFKSLDTLYPVYVQQSSLTLDYAIKTQHSFKIFSACTRGVEVVSGIAPSSLETIGEMNWPKVRMFVEEDDGTWLTMTEPESGYYNFTISFNSLDESWSDPTNITETSTMYYRRTTDMNIALDHFKAYLAEGREKSYYTEASWNNYLKELEKVALVGMAIPGPNDAYRYACTYATETASGENLNMAREALVLLPADYTAMNEAAANFIEVRDQTVSVTTYDGSTTGTVELRLYTQESVNEAVNWYYSTVNTNLYKFDQKTVDGYTATIIEKTKNLTYSDADYTYLDIAIQEFENTENLYTNDTWIKYKAAAESAEDLSRSLKADSQVLVNSRLASLVDMKNALVYREADTDELNAQIAIANAIHNEKKAGELYEDEEHFADVWVMFEQAYNEAIIAQSYNITQQAEVDSATEMLRSANELLLYYRVLDTKPLEAVLAKKPEYDRSKYVESSYQRWNSLRMEGYDFVDYANPDFDCLPEERKTYADFEEMNRLIELINSALENLEKVKADFTELRSVVAQIPSEERLALYKDEVVADIKTVVAKIDYGATFDRQTEVDKWADDLRAALAFLTEENYKDADYSGVDAAIAEANALDRTEYRNFEIVDEAIAAVDRTKKIVDQDDVDAMEQAIRAAMANLGYVLADYTEVNKAIAEAEAVENKDWYSNYYRVENIIANIDWDVTLENQEQVDAYAAAIREEIKNLKLKDADYSGVEAAIAEVNRIKPLTDFNDNFGTDLNEAIVAVQAGYTIDRQTEVDAMADRINAILATADDNLKDADYTKVNVAVAYAEGYKKTGDYKNYDEVVQPVIDAIDWELKCRDTKDKQHVKIMQDQIDAIYDAVKKLELKDADYTKVFDAIDAARAVYADNALAELPYSQESIDAVEAVISSINFDYTIRKQDLVNNYVSEIEEAVKNLKYARADYSELDAVIAQYEALERDRYTAETLEAVDKYVAKIDMDITVDRKDEVAAYVTGLTELLGKLEYLPADYTEVERALNDASKVDRKYWLADSLEILDNAVEAVEYGYDCRRQSDVDMMAENIYQAINNLQPGPADYSRVIEAIDRFSKYEHSYYTAESVATVQSIIDGINWDLTTKDQDIVDGYVIDINFALFDLVEAEADYTELLRVKASIPENLSEMYTEQTVNDLNDVVDLIDWNLKARDQSQVDNYQSALQTAIDNLEFKPFSYQEEIDLALSTWFYEGYDNEYTPESVSNFWSAYEELCSFHGEDIRDDAVAVRLLENLRYALDNMQKISVIPEDFTYEIINDEVKITGYTGTDKEVIIPSTIEGCPVTKIGEGAFYENFEITSVVIPEGVKEIGSCAFVSCQNMTSVTIPDSVITIGEQAFNCCIRLTEIDLPDNLQTIGETAFAYCTRLETVTIPSSVTSIGNGPFAMCTSLESIKVEEGNAAYLNDECGVLYNADKTTLVQYPCARAGEYVIPDSVVTIGYAAFFGAASLESVDMGANVKCIEDYAFYYCSSLTSIEIPEGLTEITTASFAATGVSEFVIPEGVKTIGCGAFDSSENLVSVTIPLSVTFIDECAFCECSALADVYYNGTRDEWNRITIAEDNEELTDATIHFVEKPCEHQYTIIVTEPTCTEQGYSTYTCSTCGDTFIADEVPALGHTSAESVMERENPATCTTDGSYDTVVYCAECSEELSRETVVLPAPGHVEGEWRVTKPAEVGVAGEETLYCKVCEEILDTKEIPAIQACVKEVEGSTTVIDKERGYIYGLEEGIYNLDGFVNFEGGTIEYVESEFGFGTGTVVNFVVDGEVIESYTIVIFGDVTGDGVIDTFDAVNLAAVVNGDIEIEEDSALYFAADIAWGDEVADTYDLATLYAVVNGDMTISQVA